MSGEKMPTLLFLYRLKTLALLHDPPDKCWHVAGELPGDHEEVARRVRHRIGVKEFEEEKFNRLVQISDILSAGADRWFSEIYSKILGSPTKILRINPLSLQETEVVKPSDEWPKKWADKLGDIFDKLGDIFERVQGSEEERYKWFYHILYGFGELLYAELYPGSVGPADTRIPHHSIFDHLCATASMVNWLCLPTSGEEIRPQGFMLVLDLAGVQEYIRTSKKMSDLGFSSLLISYLAWYLVEEVVEKIGPDVLISPTCRMNPFYYRWLLSRLEQKLKELKDELKQKLKEITFEKEGPSALALDTPAALLPSKLLLILPPLPFLAKVLSFPEKEEEIAEYFVKRYKQGWSELIEKIKQKVEHEIGEIQESRLLKEELQKAFAEMEKREVHRTPPFTLRILLVRIPEEVEREADELSKKIQEKIKDAQLKNVRLEKETLFFYEGLIKLKEKEKNFKVRGKGLLASNLSQYTQELYSKEKTYTYCTVCGELPAVLCIPRRRTAEEEGERCYEDLIPKEYRPVFDEGEHFCPYCLIKRLASTIAESEFLRIFLRKETKQRRIKSVSWYCVYPFMKVLTDERLKLEDLKQPLQDYEREIEKQDVEELIKDEAKE
ncbi:MAG: type III-B CRISPR-associated protein Cas10/Cmr2, partial [Candidatus Hadarchaeales archaeon]